MGPPAKRRKVQNYGVEEAKFDPSARQEYLSGFRKRKQARVQHAQKVAAEKARQEKIDDRKQLREQRKQELEDHVKAVNEAVRKAETGTFDSDEEAEKAHDEVENGPQLPNGSAKEEDASQAESEQEDQYIDEEKHTTVTVGPMNLHSDEEDGVSDPAKDSPDDEDRAVANEKPSKAPAPKRKAGEATKEKKKKKRKVKFHYETKSERKATKLEQTAKKRKAAMTRRAAKRG